MTDTITYDIPTGCHIDSHWGIYGIEQLDELFNTYADLGWINPDLTVFKERESNSAIIRHSLYGDMGDYVLAEYDERGTRISEGMSVFQCHEASSELYDELTDALPHNNDTVWVWEDGELFYFNNLDQFRNGIDE